MAITIGETIPDVTLGVMGPDGPVSVRSSDVLGHGRAVLFGVPGAFTPTCSDYHLPGFVIRAAELRAAGVATIACVAVNDAFVMGAWGDVHDAHGAVALLADGNGEFTRALGLELDATGFGMGLRSQRYAMVLESGVVTHLFVEEGAGLDVSSAEAVLQAL